MKTWPARGSLGCRSAWPKSSSFCCRSARPKRVWRPAVAADSRRNASVVVAGDAVVAPPGEGGLPVAAGERPVVHRRGRGAAVVDLRLELLGAVEMAVAHLERPVGRRLPGGPQGPGVHLRALEVGAVLVRLAAGEDRALELDAVVDPAEGGDAEGDVGRVEPVMAERRLGVVHPREAVHVGGRAQRRLARQAGVDEDRVARAPPARCRWRRAPSAGRAGAGGRPAA